MTLYFAWAERNEDFSPDTHTHNDLEIFDLTIQEKEGEFPKATLSINPPELPIRTTDELRKAFISWEDDNGNIKLVFQGYMHEFPAKIVRSLALIELLAKPPDSEAQLALIPFNHHPLFLKHPHVGPQEDFQLSSLYCDRRTLELSRSDWFNGQGTEQVNGTHFHDSLKVNRLTPPLAGVTIHLTLQWTQKAHGLANVGQEIAQQFPEGQMASYTPLQQKEGTLRPGKRLGRSGYWVVRSNLQRIRSITRDVGTSDFNQPTLHHYDWDFWVGWTYQQKRLEEVEITIPHRGVHKGETKAIYLCLNNPCPQHKAHPWLPGVVYFPGTIVWDNGSLHECRTEHMAQISLQADQSCWVQQEGVSPPPNLSEPSMIQSEQGENIIKHALQMARWHLAKSARCMEVSFQGAWKNFYHLTTQMSVALQDPHLPGGEITGKVTRVSLRACGDSGEHWVEVDVTCSTGTMEVHDQELPTYTLEPPDSPYEGISEPPKRLLQHIQVINSPQRQEEVLSQISEATTDTSWEKALERHSTRLQLRFSDLRSRDELRQAYRVLVPEGWSAPRQINL